MSANLLDVAHTRRNWNLMGSGTSTTDGLYVLAIRFINGNAQNIAGAFKLSQLQLEFAFTVNPKTTSLDEPFATVITPTQDGQFIESQGNIYKNISVAGNTGLRPNKKKGAVVPVLGIANPFADESLDPHTGLPYGEVTGFETLINLKNFFRTYADLKRDPDFASNMIMTWQDGKQGEYYIVEPINFKTTRDSASPLTTNYEFQLRTIEPLDVSKIFRNMDTRETDTVTSFFQRLNDRTRELRVALAFVEALVDKTASVAQAALTSVLGPLNTLVEGLTGIIRSSQRFLAIPRNSFRTLVNNIQTLADSMDGYREEINAYKTYGESSQTGTAVHALRVAARSVAAIHAESRLFSSSLSTAVTNKNSAYNRGINARGGDIPQSGIGNSVGQALIYAGESIREVAKRLLGDQAKWKQLVLLNNLKFPYIADDGDGVNILSPNDVILYPNTDSNPANISADSNSSRISGTNPIEDAYGRDLALVASKANGGNIVYDFAIDNTTGDLADVYGIANMEQTIVGIVGTEQGTLLLHPQYGMQFPLGTKAKVKTLLNFHINTRASLLRDRRIEAIQDFQATINGNTLVTSLNVLLKNGSSAIPLNIEVKR